MNYLLKPDGSLEIPPAEFHRFFAKSAPIPQHDSNSSFFIVLEVHRRSHVSEYCLISDLRAAGFVSKIESGGKKLIKSSEVVYCVFPDTDFSLKHSSMGALASYFKHSISSTFSHFFLCVGGSAVRWVEERPNTFTIPLVVQAGIHLHPTRTPSLFKAVQNASDIVLPNAKATR